MFHNIVPLILAVMATPTCKKCQPQLSPSDTFPLILSVSGGGEEVTEEEGSSLSGERNCPPPFLKPRLATMEGAPPRLLALRQPGGTCPCAAVGLAEAPTLPGHPQTVPSVLCYRWVHEVGLSGAFVKPRTSDPNSSASQDVG